MDQAKIPHPARRVVILHSGDRESRFAPLRDAFLERGVSAVMHQYSDASVGATQELLLRSQAVLVWVNPIEDGRNRSRLDAMLRTVSEAGIYVSAHPDIILKLGTKEVLYTTRELPWGCDTDLYRSFDELRLRLPERLGNGEVRVLKQYRGNGGSGVWKVAGAQDGTVRVRHAERGSAELTMSMTELFELVEVYFEHGAPMIDQPWQPRLPEGMVRCYLVHDRVVGFGHQRIVALHPTEPPGPRLYHPETLPQFQPLRSALERRWVPAMQRLLKISAAQLPALWDCDFLLGPRDAEGQDSYVLCEINVSSVSPFPDSALAPLADAVVTRLGAD